MDAENNPRDLWVDAEGTEVFLVFEGLNKLDFYSLSETNQGLIRDKLDAHFFLEDAANDWAKDADNK
jgi:hypothetical protein